MRTSKVYQLISLTIAVTAVMLILKSGIVQEADKELRRLATATVQINQTEIYNVCSAAVDLTGMNYTNYFKNWSQSVDKYFIPSTNSTNAAYLIDYLKTGNMTDVTTYAWQRAAPYIVFIAFAVIVLICWVFYFICCCCPCCCCKKNEDDGCCKFLSYVIVICAYVGIIIGCIIGFIYSGQFVTNLGKSSCAFLQVYSDTMWGQSKNTTPVWIGIQNIQYKLGNTSAALNTIAQNSATAFSNTGWTKTLPNQFITDLQNNYNTYKSSTLKNRNPATSKAGGVTTITPTYIKTYGDYQTQYTALNNIYLEFNTKIQASITAINNAQSYSQQITTSINQIQSNLNNIETQIGTLSSTFETDVGNVLSTWITTQNQVNNNGVKGFLVLFALIITLAVLGIIFSTFYAFCCPNGCNKFILIVIWNLLTVITILTFILGGVFGVIGLASNDGVSVMEWVFGSQNLESSSPKVITSPTNAKRIDVCMNGNGDLSSEFISSSSSTNYLSQLYNISFQINSYDATIKANQNSEVITNQTAEYNKIINDITLSTDSSDGNNDITAVMTQWRDWSDASQNVYQKSCSPAAYDVWVQTGSTKCPSGYTYSTSGGSLGNKNCIPFTAFTGNINTRYTSMSGCSSSGSSDFTSVSDADIAYYNGMNSYTTDNSNLLSNLISTNNDMNKSFVTMANDLLTTLSDVKTVTDPLYNLFQSIVGQNGLFTLINCLYMGEDMKNFYYQLQNNLSPAASSLGGVIIAVSFLEAISVFFLLIVINKSQPQDQAGQNPVESMPKN